MSNDQESAPPEGYDIRITSERGETGLKSLHIEAVGTQAEIDLEQEESRIIKLLSRSREWKGDGDDD